ncbi:hypothetical protein M0802_000830 [Mischocyttarus mexicanus]|nr:hypothetical protein M0802_000830 [Mischocyttarus mexicanus]
MFQGFPFDDDDDFGRRTDIRAHLDDLAARHPEFADHLIGPPWGDIPFRGSTYNNQRRGSGNGGSSSYPNYPDEDTRSQASGSSATSAASGASGVSSHGEPESSSSSSNRSKNQQYKQPHREERRNPIPQYGLRNTVDIGQHHRDNMENSEKDSRGQRSMSAPPENRQQTNLQEQDKSQQQPGQRFVSRVDIIPQHNQPQSSPSPQQSSPPPPPPPTQQSQGNVRHIPIFVEGRDEPVISKNIDSPFQRQQSPPQFHNSSHFTKPSSFSNLGFGSRQWRPHFQESFYNPNSSFDHSPTRRTQQAPNYQQPKPQQYAEKQRNEQQPPRHHQYESQPQEHHQPRQRARQQQEPKSHPQQQTGTAPGQQAQQQEAPKHVPKQTLPKDPLEKVASVQNEVDSLAEQVKQYTGNSRQDKQYMFLDEMLTRELIKLDDIETEGRENVRQARKNAIRTIQETISLLESKASLSGQEQPQEDLQSMQVEQYKEQEKENQPSNESMDVDQNNEQNLQSNEAIPLPPGPSSPKVTTESNETTVAVAQIEPQNVSTENQQMEQEQEVLPPAENKEENAQQQQQDDVAVVVEKPLNENTNNITEVTMQIDSSTPMEVQGKVIENIAEEGKDNKDENQNLSKEIKTEDSVEQKSTEEQKQISDSQEKIKGTSKSPLSPKIVKKAKKQAAPISEKAIPLPPPQSMETNAK